jgi:hypothetical protein
MKQNKSFIHFTQAKQLEASTTRISITRALTTINGYVQIIETSEAFASRNRIEVIVHLHHL